MEKKATTGVEQVLWPLSQKGTKSFPEVKAAEQ